MILESSTRCMTGEGDRDTDGKDGNVYNTSPSNLFISRRSSWGSSIKTKDNAL